MTLARNPMRGRLEADARRKEVDWPLLGILIGIYAAQKRGFSVVGGAIGGLLLGPLAFLMFFVSGITRSNEQKKCPYCAEFVKSEAIVCKHCGKDLPAAKSAGGIVVDEGLRGQG